MNLITRPELAMLPAGASRRERRRQAIQIGSYLAEDCARWWREFEQLPGTHLTWHPRYAELRAPDEHILASTGRFSYRPSKLSTGGRSYSRSKPRRARYQDPLIAEIAEEGYRDFAGHFGTAGLDRGSARYQRSVAELQMLVDDAGIPVLYITGSNYCYAARARFTFPDRRWLRFLVRGPWRTHAIMTAVDQAGNSVIRYRNVEAPDRSRADRHMIEVAVHPGRELTDELLLAIAASFHPFANYFSISSQ